ncbi:MAG TPA: hypothetical protein VI670_20700 [Thermoanaerobaculia bacterium]|jgi:hypothetical protein
MRALRLEEAQHFEAVSLRQQEVEDDGVEVAPPQPLDGLGSVAGGLVRNAVARQDRREQIADARMCNRASPKTC